MARAHWPGGCWTILFSFDDAWETEPIRKISFYFCLAALFLRLGVVPS